MTNATDEYDFFVSYARADNVSSDGGPGWVERFVDAVIEEHRSFTGGRTLRPFFDRRDISNFATWESEIFHKGLTRSRLFLAFLSPAYFASEVCRREWKAWLDQEIARHILAAGAAPVYFVEVPGLVAKPMLSESEVARNVAELCRLAEPRDRFFTDVTPVLQECRRRQLVTWIQDNAVRPFVHAGMMDLHQADLRKVLRKLAEDLDARAEDVRRAEGSVSTVPPYNPKFTGRRDELLDLRRMLKYDHTGVVCGVAGLGGIGKSELAYTYAHAFASVYPGGRFYVPCDHAHNLRDAVLVLGDQFRDQISDEERLTPEAYFAAICRCLRRRLDQRGHILLVLDNVTDPALVSRGQTDALTALGPKLHLLATTRLLPPSGTGWLTLGELSESEALELLEKHRPFDQSDPRLTASRQATAIEKVVRPVDAPSPAGSALNDVESEREAALRIVRKLGGFALAIELVAAGLAAHPSATYAGVADGLALGDLDVLAEDRDVELRSAQPPEAASRGPGTDAGRAAAGRTPRAGVRLALGPRPGAARLAARTDGRRLSRTGRAGPLG